MAEGRPLRFLGLVAGSWITLRVVMLWPTIETLPDLARAMLPHMRAEAPASPLVERVATELPPPVARFGAHAGPAVAPEQYGRPRMIVALAGLVSFGAAVPIEEKTASEASVAPVGLPPPAVVAATSGSRWSVSGWLLARGGRGASLDTPQLSGSQAGIRVAYLIDRRHRLALAARVVTPLRGRGREAAIGLDWQPTRLPARLLVEQRFGLDGQRGGPAALLVSGFGPSAIGHGFTLEGYGEAGAVARKRLDGFADGALRLAYPFTTLGGMRFDLGAGTWGAAQRGVDRIDIGPSVGATIPIAQHAIRLSVDWRQRVAGNARPGSGPAVTLGADF